MKAEEIFPEIPIGYKFIPTDQELVWFYLINKIFCRRLPAPVIKDINATEFYSKPPHMLEIEKNDRKEWFFFIHQSENYHDGWKSIRMVGNEKGFWKYTGEEELIDCNGHIFAFKICLRYYYGMPPKEKRSHWIMKEYRLSKELIIKMNCSKKEEWVLGRLQSGRNSDCSQDFNIQLDQDIFELFEDLAL